MAPIQEIYAGHKTSGNCIEELYARRFAELTQHSEWHRFGDEQEFTFSRGYFRHEFSVRLSQGIIFPFSTISSDSEFLAEHHLHTLYTDRVYSEALNKLYADAYKASVYISRHQSRNAEGRWQTDDTWTEVSVGSMLLRFQMENMHVLSERERTVIGALLVMDEDMFTAVGERGLVCIEEVDSVMLSTWKPGFKGVEPHNIVVAIPDGQDKEILQVASMGSLDDDFLRARDFLDATVSGDVPAPVGMISAHSVSSFLETSSRVVE